MLKTEAVVTFRKAGFHCWPDAPLSRHYLRLKHRHLFVVRVSVEVLHNDREVEFHDLLEYCEANFPSGDLGARSCEMLAHDLLEVLQDKYKGRAISVYVSEDNECGALVTFEP